MSDPTFVELEPSGSVGECSSGGGGSCVVRIGTWNVSWWTAARLAPVVCLKAQLVALQETKLHRLQVESVRSSLKRLGFTLHHGHAVSEDHGGHSGGVGVLASPGVAVAPLLPQGAAWRRLHAMARVHAVQVPPRPGLPLGLRVFSVYAPLHYDRTREVFGKTFMELVACLDMQIPTLLLGDFNGSVTPDKDFSSAERPVCPLLSRLLGPGGPFLDLLLVVSPEEFAHTFHSSVAGAVVSSRIDLALGNRAVLPFVERVSVVSGTLEGGHSPFVVELRQQAVWALSWSRPLRQLPALLRQSSRALQGSELWMLLLRRWVNTSEVHFLLTGATSSASAQRLSSLLARALLTLVTMAGGWHARSPRRRMAYDSCDIRRLRATLRVLGLCLSELRRDYGCVGSYSQRLVSLLQKLSLRGLVAPDSSRAALQEWVASQVSVG